MRCVYCGHKEFTERTALLNTPLLTFFGLDWANRSATLLVCNDCNYVHWFLGKPGEAQGDASHSEAMSCLACQTQIPPGKDECPSCGWSWKSR